MVMLVMMVVVVVVVMVVIVWRVVVTSTPLSGPSRGDSVSLLTAHYWLDAAAGLTDGTITTITAITTTTTRLLQLWGS